MSKFFAIAMVVFLIAASAINCCADINVKIKIPDNVKDCSRAQGKRLVNTAHELTFQYKSFLNGQHFYDIENQCSLYLPYCEHTRHADFDNSTVITASIAPSNDYVCLAGYGYIMSADGSYNNFLEEKQSRLLQMAEERKLNQRLILPLPEYEGSDSVMDVALTKSTRDALHITNKGTNFIKILAISTYFNGKINTISDVNLEVPPESNNTTGFTITKLLSNDMCESLVVIRKELDKARTGKTKFGFAIKYIINGKEGNYFSVKEYENSAVFAGVH